jgi:hypothetical protein
VDYALTRHAFGIGSAEKPYPQLDRAAAALGVTLRLLDAPSEAAAWYKHLGDRVFLRAPLEGPYDAVELPVAAAGSVYQILDGLEKACRDFKARHPRTAVVVSAEAGPRLGISREAFVYALWMRRSPVDRVLVEHATPRELKALGRFGLPIDALGGWPLLEAAFATPGVESFTVRGLSESQSALSKVIGAWTTRGGARAGPDGLVRVRGIAGLYRLTVREEGKREAYYEGRIEPGRATKAVLRPSPGAGKVPSQYASLSPHVKPEQILDGELRTGKGPGEAARAIAAGESIEVPGGPGWNLKLALDFTVPGGRPLAAVQVFAGRRRLLFEDLAPGGYRLEFETAGAERAVVQFVPGAGKAQQVLAGAASEVQP